MVPVTNPARPCLNNLPVGVVNEQSSNFVSLALAAHHLRHDKHTFYKFLSIILDDTKAKHPAVEFPDGAALQYRQSE